MQQRRTILIYSYIRCMENKKQYIYIALLVSGVTMVSKNIILIANAEQYNVTRLCLSMTIGLVLLIAAYLVRRKYNAPR